MIPEQAYWQSLSKEQKEHYRVSDNFYLVELLPPELFTLNKWDMLKLLKYIDPKIYKILETARKILGQSLTVNNWHVGGQFKYRCVRLPACKEYRKGSMHASEPCKAVDFSIEKHDAEKVFHKLTNASNWPLLEKAGATRLESFADTPRWQHIDCKEVIGAKLPLIVMA